MVRSRSTLPTVTASWTTAWCSSRSSCRRSQSSSSTGVGMRASGVPLTVAVGAENRDTWYGAAAAWLAEGTGADLVELPGGHGGSSATRRTSSSWCAASSADLLAWWRPRRTRTDELPIMSRILRVGLDGSRRIDPAHVGCAVAPDGSRSIQTDRLDDHGMIKAHPTKNRMPRQAGKRMGLALWAGSRR